MASKQATQLTERRQEQRQPAAGMILIQVAPGGIIPSHLVDTSVHGFSITHHYQGFSAGQQVRALHSWGEVAARVVWVGAREGDVVTGFRTD